MSDAILRFTDPDNDATVRLDLSTYIAGEVTPDFGIPEERRRVKITLDLQAASKQALVDLWRDVVEQVELGSHLEVRLNDLANSVWIRPFVKGTRRTSARPEDLSRAVALYDWIEGSQNFMQVLLDLVCERTFVGPLTTAADDASVDNTPAPNNVVVVAAPAGDVEAPAEVQLEYGTVTPNRMTTLLFRRTVGNPDNFVSLLQAEAAINLGSGVDLFAGVLRYQPPNNNLNRLGVWRINANQADNVGRVQVWAVVRDAATASGNLKLQVDVTFEDASLGVAGPLVRILADAAHLSSDYELWYLGTHAIPTGPPSVWNYRLYAQRTTGSAEVRVDYLLVAPVDESAGGIDWDADANVTADTDAVFSFDTEKRRAWWGALANFKVPAGLLGNGLWLRPGVQNNIIVAAAVDTHTALDHDPPGIGNPDGIVRVFIRYRPRYLWVR